MFARHAQTGVFAVEAIQLMHMRYQHAMDFPDLRCGQVLAGVEEMLDLAEQPRAALCGAAYHHRIRAGLLQHVFDFLRRGDIAVGDDRDAHAGLDRSDGVVFGIAGVGAGAGASVYRQSLNAAGFGDPGDADGIAILLVPTGAYLERDRHIHRADHRFQQLSHQRFILQQRGTGHHVANFLGRTTHIDVDDLRAVIHVVLRGLRQHMRIGADDLHRDRIDLTFMVGASLSLFRTIQQ